MGFLVWENEADSQASLAAVNAKYGCPYVALNGYKMDIWDEMTQSQAMDEGVQRENWGWFKPISALGVTQTELMAELVGECEDLPERESDWLGE